jgi:putative transposase
MAVISAHGVRADGVREVLGVDGGLSEDVVLWRELLQSLIARGVRGVKLVTSDTHPGLKQAIAEVFVGAAWQRGKGHVLRNLAAQVPKNAQQMVMVAVRPIFDQGERSRAQAKLKTVCETLGGRVPGAGHDVAGGELG